MSGDGIVDYALDPKPGVSAAALRSFVGEMVLLATGPAGIVVYPDDTGTCTIVDTLAQAAKPVATKALGAREGM